jgi:BirA family biotin operon repressor/biotin-[acetyl-CoA-carboxylase] ligase
MNNEMLSSEEILEGLRTKLIGREILCYPSLSSTMETAAAAAREGTKEGTIIVAEEQVEGRGRMKRQWLTPPGNISLSLIIKPQLEHLPYMIMIASLAAAKSIEGVTGLKTAIKWPNDILIDRRKVAGILIESKLKGKEVVYTIIGIGINIRLNTLEYPEIATTATSLENEMGRGVSRTEILRQLLVELEHYYLKEEKRLVYEKWRKALVTLGKNVKVNICGQVYKGIAEDVDEDGGLWLRREDGNAMKVLAGDVHLQD